jgi:hypothetical protein
VLIDVEGKIASGVAKGAIAVFAVLSAQHSARAHEDAVKAIQEVTQMYGQKNTTDPTLVYCNN